MKHPEAFAYALRGLGIEDVAVRFKLSREEAKRIVWAAHDKGGGRRPGRFGKDGLEHEADGEAAKGRKPSLVASVPPK